MLLTLSNSFVFQSPKLSQSSIAEPLPIITTTVPLILSSNEDLTTFSSISIVYCTTNSPNILIIYQSILIKMLQLMVYSSRWRNHAYHYLKSLNLRQSPTSPWTLAVD